MIKKAVNKAKKNAEVGAKKNVLEELFYDFNASKSQIYTMNFFRGIFFGFGSVIGGTIVVAILVALLGLLTDIPGGIGDFIKSIVDTVNEQG